MITPDTRTALHRFRHDAMACTFEVLLVGDDAKYARQAATAAFAEVDQLEQLLSRFLPESDIAQINALQPGQSVRVSVKTIECLQLASRVYTETGGVFDIAYRSAGPRSDAAPLVLDPKNHAVGVQKAGVRLDLGGLGKGYALDQMATVLREWSVQAALVHSGRSTVYAIGAPPRAKGWSVALRAPDASGESLETMILRNEALAGSGQRLHGRHIVDPRGEDTPGEDAAAWAGAPSAALADALSTAFLLMPPTEVEALCRRLTGVWAILHDDCSTGERLRRFPAHGGR